jgi:hypothetical protein
LGDVHGQIYSASSYLSDFNGNIIKANPYPDAKGSPYLIDEWCKGEIVNSDGKHFEIEKMKYNVLLNRVEYDLKGVTYEPNIVYQAFTFQQPVGDGTFVTRTFRNGLPVVDRNDARKFYEVLYQGGASILKSHAIIMSEYAEPLSIARTVRLRLVSDLYLRKPSDNNLQKVPKKKKDVISLFADKEKEISEFLSNNKLKSISEANLISLCKYYDDLN